MDLKTPNNGPAWVAPTLHPQLGRSSDVSALCPLNSAFVLVYLQDVKGWLDTTGRAG